MTPTHDESSKLPQPGQTRPVDWAAVADAFAMLARAVAFRLVQPAAPDRAHPPQPPIAAPIPGAPPFPPPQPPQPKEPINPAATQPAAAGKSPYSADWVTPAKPADQAAG